MLSSPGVSHRSAEVESNNYFFPQYFLLRISVPHLGRLIPRETISSAHWVSTAYVRARDIDYDDNDDKEDSEECVGCPRCFV